MHLGFRIGAIAALALAASPVAAQRSVSQLPTADLTAHSVPPAPPPERRATTPLPFPPMSRTAPHHARSRKTAETVPTSRRRVTGHEAGSRAMRHSAAAATHSVSKQEKKDQLFCATLSHRRAMRNDACRKLERQKPQVARPHQPTKQDKKDEARCSSLSLRQVMKDRKCREVAERQLHAVRDQHSAKSSKHHDVSSRKPSKRPAGKASQSRSTKHRRR